MTKNEFPRISSNYVFLIDGLGALLTAGFIYLLMTFFPEWVSLPYEVLRILTLVALGFAVYSLCSHFFVKGKRRKILVVIIVANIIYAFTTLILLLIYRERIALPGLIYFLSEVLVIFFLVRWEARVVRRSQK